MVALTFEVGPNEIATPVILDVLADRGVPATFFVFGTRASAHPDHIARMNEAGHGVQPHWAGHDSHHDLDKAALEADIARTMDALKSLGCPTPTIWGQRTATSRIRRAMRLRRRTVSGWSPGRFRHAT